MITISDILKPRHIELDLKQTNHEEAIFHVASLLKDDERVLEWNKFYGGLKSKNPCIAAGKEFQICIPHVRTSAVSGMVMSVGHSVSGIEFPGELQKIHYIFVIGVPSALAADYLRIIGALARIFKEPAAKLALRTVKDRLGFLEILTQSEMKL